MTSLNLLIKVAYLPAAVIGLLTAEKGQAYLEGWNSTGATIHQNRVSSVGFSGWQLPSATPAGAGMPACTAVAGTAPQGWTSPTQAAVGPERPGCGNGGTRLLLPHPLRLGVGHSTRYERRGPAPGGQESGMWIGGLSLATFGLLGAILMLGLVQRWLRRFPALIIGLAGRRVPIALAVVPASLVSVLLIVGGHRDLVRLTLRWLQTRWPLG